MNISYNNLKSLKDCPEEVDGSIYCSYNKKLTSLEGLPKIINGSLILAVCSIDTLVGGPDEIKGNFNLSQNKLTSLKGSPKKVEGNFTVNNNEIDLLDGAPQEVGGDFLIYGNAINFTKEDIQKVTNVKGKIYV